MSKYNPFDINPYKNCFLCEIELNEDNLTNEHVFGQWMLKDFDLDKMSITLINNQNLKYRSITIPCCVDCNTGTLSRNEDIVSRGVRSGYNAFKQINEKQIVSWLGKIFMGLIIKETNLREDVKDKDSKTIHNPEILSRKYINFAIIRASHHETNSSENLYSLFVFEMDPSIPFWYYSSPDYNSILMILNGIGIILFLQDGGMMKHYFNNSPLKNTRLRTIKPEELFEIYGRLVYFINRVDYLPKFHFDGNIGSRRINNLHVINPFESSYYYIDKYDENSQYYFINSFFYTVNSKYGENAIEKGQTCLKEYMDEEFL